FEAGNVFEVFRVGRIGHVEDRGAVELSLPGELVHRLWHVRRAAMVADIGDVAVALLMDGRLIGRARLQVVHTDEAHVGGFGRIADLRRLGERGGEQKRSHRKCQRMTKHRDPPHDLLLASNLSLRSFPRKRESSSWPKHWGPAFAGTSGKKFQSLKLRYSHSRHRPR